MTIGTDLRRAREERGVSLREIADRTKIRVPVLRAIENDDFRSVPGGVILRGFLKLYAREVGLDPDDIARRCLEMQLGETGAAGPETTDGSHAAQPAPPVAPTGSRLPVLVLAVALVAIGGGYLAWSRAARPAIVAAPAAEAAQQAPAEAPRAEPTASPSPAPAPAAPVTATVPPPPAPASGVVVPGALRVEVRATAECWLSATADGQQVAYRVLNAGDRVSLSVKDEAVLRIGMPGNVAVSVNEAPVKPFARPGTPTTLRITPANYRELLAP